MTFMMLGSALELFSRHLLQILRLQAASRHRPIAFAPEGSSLDGCLPVNDSGLVLRGCTLVQNNLTSVSRLMAG
jgi:hypothetical protein